MSVYHTISIKPIHYTCFSYLDLLSQYPFVSEVLVQAPKLITCPPWAENPQIGAEQNQAIPWPHIPVTCSNQLPVILKLAPSVPEFLVLLSLLCCVLFCFPLLWFLYLKLNVLSGLSSDVFFSIFSFSPLRTASIPMNETSNCGFKTHPLFYVRMLRV